MKKGTPKEAGKMPNTKETMPTVKAYGICVFTCWMWLHELAIELRMVVSEIGEQWSPNTAPASTEATTLWNIERFALYSKPKFKETVHANGSMRGYRIAIVPHEDPVENATIAASRNVMEGMA